MCKMIKCTRRSQNFMCVWVGSDLRGYSHVKEIWGCAAKMGQFLQEISKHGSHFYDKILS